MRLINEDDVIKAIQGMKFKTAQQTIRTIGAINKIPTAYAVDKVIEQLEDYREDMRQFRCQSMLSDMIEVVKMGGIDG